MPVVTTKQANGSFADQVFDEVVGSARKWFTLSNNSLDGTFHPIPANGSEQVGFIGILTGRRWEYSETCTQSRWYR